MSPISLVSYHKYFSFNNTLPNAQRFKALQLYYNMSDNCLKPSNDDSRAIGKVDDKILQLQLRKIVLIIPIYML